MNEPLCTNCHAKLLHCIYVCTTMWMLAMIVGAKGQQLFTKIKDSLQIKKLELESVICKVYMWNLKAGACQIRVPWKEKIWQKIRILKKKSYYFCFIFNYFSAVYSGLVTKMTRPSTFLMDCEDGQDSSLFHWVHVLETHWICELHKKDVAFCH